MKQSLQLRLGQQLTMTPQLQQAIRLLQLSALDLQAEVQEALESNPMLETAEGEDQGSGEQTEWDASTESKSADAGSVEGKASDAEAPAAGDASDVRDSGDQLSEIPGELPVDSSWDEIYDAPLVGTSYSQQDAMPMEAQASDSAETLQDHLIWQMRLTALSDVDRSIAEAIIDAINEDGYLSVPLESLLEGISSEDRSDVEVDELEAVLRLIQRFDPVGVAARDLRECLLIQIEQLNCGSQRVSLARKLVANYLELLANRDYAQIMRRLKIQKNELQDVIDFIQSLNPRPGSVIAPTRTEYVVPDVTVKKERNVWRVELNPEAMPKIRINSVYAGFIKRADNSQENTFLKNNLQEARWLIKSLQSRNETLLKVATCIVERQQGFLEHGEEAMKALVLHDVAEAVGMHESTISRVTSQKYMHTPRGIFELKYFFSSHVTTASGGACSATAIRALIKKLIAAENAAKPLSDSKIAGVLSEQGINVARRTVAKYREGMSIPPSNERKRLA